MENETEKLKAIVSALIFQRNQAQDSLANTLAELDLLSKYTKELEARIASLESK